ncbi:MAG: hypothetical protein EZS28_040915 [Streblomastix strix]|uniref:Uncharacterized protein n=1 Tax=Streblomastix strix TaxID=222440 RepID=A0A5J4U006_9EUKA|nr:MAG: hypothetical protein EZS28_040915 [Streblomastix strix]
MSVFPVAVCTVVVISFPDLREPGQKRASVAPVDYCVSEAFNALPSPWLLLCVAQLLPLALLTVLPRKNRFAMLLVQIAQPRAPVLLLSRSAVPLLGLRLFSQGPVDLSPSSGRTRSQTSVLAARRPAAGFAVLISRNSVSSMNPCSSVVCQRNCPGASSFLLQFLKWPPHCKHYLGNGQKSHFKQLMAVTQQR